MQETPFNRITHSSQRQLWVFFTLLSIIVALTMGMYWGIQRIIDQEQKRFTLDFSTLVGYVHEQETFLRQLRIQNEQLSSLPFLRVTRFHEIATPSGWPKQLFEGRESVVSMPFSLACEEGASCSKVPDALFSLGSYLSDFYSSFWASSYFPAAAIFFADENSGISVSVPAINVDAGYDPIDIQTYHAVIEAMRQQLRNSDHKSCELAQGDNAKNTITWFSAKTLPDQLIGLIPAGFSPSIWDGFRIRPTCIYAATLLSRSRIGVLERNINPAPMHVFWLQYRNNTWLTHREFGMLMGDDKTPELEHPGLHYTLNGLMLKITDESGNWSGIYRISYASFFRDNLWLPFGTLLMLLISLLGSFAYMRWYNRYVILPAQEAQREILESEAFNRTLIQTAPVALCLIARDSGNLVFANALALDWLKATVGMPLPPTRATTKLLSLVQHAVREGSIERLEMSDAQTLYVAYAPTRYRLQNVILCAFADVSAHAEMERNLTRAKKAADEANEAKSTFLATMSHEIRTPLYGTLGTLELLSLTQLNRQQRQYVDRIESSSQMLLQIISDILDISKIETGQLQLEEATFNPRELVQNCTGAYAGMAYHKGLLLFSVVAIDVPAMVMGDPTRIRQILSNLISNAIKFTESGYVIVNISLVEGTTARAQLLLEVRDSGIGISKLQQQKLFTPFYMVDADRNIVRGTGLGLSICARLAELMKTHIQLISEPLIGSKFFLELNLEIALAATPVEPQLRGANIRVQTPHPELTENICSWLQYWGAEASPIPPTFSLEKKRNIFLNISQRPQSMPDDWEGQYLNLSLSGETISNFAIDAYSFNSIGFGLDYLLHEKQHHNESHENTLPHFNLRILVAEDNPLNQVTLQGQLEQLGCEVTLASDGEEALALWDINPHDMVLTDVNMPYLNGYELTRRLRSEGVTLPIIGVTANAMLDEERRCVEAGMDAWLVKPIGLHELVVLLHKYAPSDALSTQIYDDADFDLIQPNVLDKHRDIFLVNMWDDWHQLNKGIVQCHADTITIAIHRMRGALVLTQYRALASRMAAIEQHVQTHGMDESSASEVVTIAEEIRQLLVHIESSQ